MKIRKESRVLVKSINIPGIVVSLYESPIDSVLLINLDNGDKIKCLASDVTLIEEPKHEEPTITRDDFRKAVEVVLDPSNYSDHMGTSSIMMFTLSGVVIASKLEKELFGETVGND